MIELFKSNKGISMIILGVTIMIMIIISSIVVYNINYALKVKQLTNMYNDIELLQDRISIYYSKYGGIPVKGEQLPSTIIPEESKDPTDNDVYYQIDTQALENITLTYGRKGNGNELDIYIINEKTHVIYYPKGIENDGMIIYKLNR